MVLEVTSHNDTMTALVISSTMIRLALFAATLNSWLLSECQAFYLPGVNPQSFEDGDV